MIVLNEPTTPRAKTIAICRPPAIGALHCQPLIRTPAIIPLHYFETRSVPCLGEPCVLCAAKIPTEQRLFMLVRRMELRRIEVCELPRSHFETLIEIREKCFGLQNSILVMTRPRGLRCSPIDIRWVRVDELVDPRPIYDGWLDRLEMTWSKNVEYAVQTIAAKISSS